MNPHSPAPKGRHAIAQGNALGSIVRTSIRPEGAESSDAETHSPVLSAWFRPFRAWFVWWLGSQGVALGYRSAPRWGFEPEMSAFP